MLGKLFLYLWLVVEFFLIVYATLSLMGKLLSPLHILPYLKGVVLAISSVVCGCVAIVMNFHPYYKLILLNARKRAGSPK